MKDDTFYRTDEAPAARDRRIGQELVRIIRDTLRSQSLYPLTTIRGMDLDGFNRLLDEASADAVNPNLKAYFALSAGVPTQV